MLIDKKYFYLATGNSYMEYPPKIYIDFFVLKADLKRNWKSNNTFQFEIGLFGKTLTGNIYWNFIERKRTKYEDEKYRATMDFIEKFNKGNK